MSEKIKEEVNISGEKTQSEDTKSEDLSKLYTDETQDIVRSMQVSADKMTENYHDNPFGAGDIVRDIILFFVTVAGAFGWLMLMLLIFSFVALSYVHLKFDKMIIASIIFAVVVGIIYIVAKSKKYVRFNDEKRKRKEAKRKEQLEGDPNESFLFKDNGNNN
ncbi:MAG: hypothetical protein K5669_12075 [Lachnospiraceae bacterium]|nr:hypothetical protein [Lachnospiraceae bacterium]